MIRAWAPPLALLCALLTTAPRPAPAQPDPPALPSLPVDYSIRHWSGKDRLPLRSVEAILQTRDGFIWFGMNNGLGRFDGANFQVFEPANTPALPVSYVTTLAEDRDGSLWIGSAGGGLARFTHGRFHRYSEADGLANEQVKALHVAGNGTLWIGTDGGGIFSRDPATGAFQQFREPHGLPEPFVFGITEDTTGRLLVVTHNHGPLRQSGNRFEPIPLDPPHSGESGFALTRSPQGRIWLGTSSGIYRLEDDVFRRWEPSLAIPGHDPVVAWETEPDRVWLGTAQGLVLWDHGRCTSYPIGGGSSGRFASAFLEDREGSLWTNAEGAGVVQLRRTKFVTIGPNEGLAHDVVTAVTTSRDGALWVGTPKGLHRFLQGRNDTFRLEHGLPDDFIFSLAQDTAGTFWVATRLGGLATFDGQRFIPIPPPHQIPVRGAWCITPTRDGSVWVGTTRGAFRYQNQQRVEHLVGEDVLSNDDVRAIAEDRDGTLWFGTSYGLNRRRNGVMQSFSKLEGLPPIEVTVALHPDPDGSLWIGTMTRGLFLCRSNRFHHFGAPQGFLADGIMSITPEADKALWIGSSRGVHRISRRSLLDVADGLAPQVSVQSFGRKDGLISEECSGTIQPTAARDAEGRLWISTSDGLATIHPDRIPENPTPPRTHIERIALEGASPMLEIPGRTAAEAHAASTPTHAILRAASEPLNPQTPASLHRATFEVAGIDTVWIPPGQDRLEFQYAGLSFVLPEAVQFSYKLENYDPDWVRAGTRRVAYYTRIPPGRYVFRVRATNDDSTAGEPANLAVVVAPAWWQTPLLRASAAIILATALSALIGIRIRALQRRQHAASELSRHLIRSQERERSRLAGELHDGIGQEIQLIRNRSELALQRLEPTADLARELHAISATAARAIHGVRSLSRGLRPPELDQLGLTQALRWLGTNAAEASSSRLESSIAPIDGLLPRELELDLYRVAQEALNNAMKHGHASEITLEVERDPQQITLSVFDNGQGFDPATTADQPTSGSGLSTMRERAAMLGGTLDIRSERNIGTRLTLLVPLPTPPT